MKESGFSSIQTIFILFILILSVLGLGTDITLTTEFYQKNENIQNNLEALQHEVKAIIDQLNKDPTPWSDSPFDPVHDYISRQSEKYEYLKLTDVSSRINPNWVRSVFFKKTDLKNLLKNGVSPDSFRDYRNEIGSVMDMVSGYSGLIGSDALEKYFTPYSFLNVNTAYEYVLRDMYALITGNSDTADNFHTFIAGALSEKHIITEKELNHAAAKDYDAIYPVISTLPEMNIHFIPEFILKQVINYPYGGKKIENSSSIVDTLLAVRRNEEVTPEKLHNLIDTKGLQKRVFQHLGTKTWFWKLEIETRKTAVEAIIVCFPLKNIISLEIGTKPEYGCRLYSFLEVKGIY